MKLEEEGRGTVCFDYDKDNTSGIILISLKFIQQAVREIDK